MRRDAQKPPCELDSQRSRHQALPTAPTSDNIRIAGPPTAGLRKRFYRYSGLHALASSRLQRRISSSLLPKTLTLAWRSSHS
jgi:hypothetical protein